MNARRIALALCVFFQCVVSAQGSPPPPTPRLLLDAAEIDALKVKAAGPFAVQWAQWRASADKLLVAPVQLPPRGGNWSHNYVCPEHGARLMLGKQIGPWQWEHICPVGNHILYGDPANGTLDFDGNAIMDIHLHYADAVVTLGVAYQLTGDRRYALRAKEILLAYAEKYRTYPIHGKQLQKNPGTECGRISTQPLTESTWLIGITQGADLIWDTLSPDERTAVADKIMHAALDDVILRTSYGIHNMQCRMNSAIGLVGLLLNDRELIHTAIDDPKTGFRQQIEHGVRDDGMWLEGSNGYHFFTLEGLWPLAEAARHCGIDLYSPKYKSMFDAPLLLASPHLQLPNFNDSEIVNIPLHADVYELAYARWNDPAYLRIIGGGNRDSRLAFLYGVPSLPTSSSTTRSLASHNSGASGYAMLASGVGDDAAWLCLKYGPYGGMHGHQDKNSFVLYDGPEVIAADAGTHAYGSPLHTGWDKTSIAHNTLTVDEVTQAPATGKCLAFGSDGGVDYVMANAGPIYPDKGIDFIRTLAMVDMHTILGIDTVKGDGRKHTLDVAFHLPGAWVGLPTGLPWQATIQTPYQFIKQTSVSRAAPFTATTLSVKNRDHLTELTLLGDQHAPTDVITGEGVGESTKDAVPTAIFRRQAATAEFIWVIGLDGHHASFEAIPSDAETIVVKVNGVYFTVNPQAGSLSIRKSSKVDAK